jgi:phage terminase large subunit GpA-like protein
MEDMSPRSPVQRVIVLKGAQLGCTEMALNCISYYLAAVPAPVLYVAPTVLTATRFSRQRLSEAIALSPTLTELMATPRGGERTNSILMKAARSGALLLLSGGNSAASLRSMPIRVLILDEVDSYPISVDNEGDACDLAIARTESYGVARKILLISTPTDRGASRIEAAYQQSDERKFHVQCPLCGSWITLEFEQLYLENGAARYRCQLCNESFTERNKHDLILGGEWRATAPGAPTVHGYHLSQVYSLWTSWADLVARHAAAQATPERQKVFQNTALGLSWGPEAVEPPTADVLMARAEPWPEGIVPAGGCLLTGGVDVQADRLECEVVAWGANFESWSVFYGVLYGDTSQAQVWQRLDELLLKDWRHESGMPLLVQACCIDGGFSMHEVQAFTRSRHSRRVYCTKGISSGFGKPIWPRRASWSKTKDALYMISSDEGKFFLSNRLRVEKPGAGFCHTPMSRERAWYEQLTCERLVVLKGKRCWINPQRQRNEALDARCLAIAALHARLITGMDLNDFCRKFEAMLEPPPQAARVNGPPPQPPVVRSKFVWG